MGRFLTGAMESACLIADVLLAQYTILKGIIARLKSELAEDCLQRNWYFKEQG
jgi:hypothetical protein